MRTVPNEFAGGPPHIHSPASVFKITGTTALALLPAAAATVLRFGLSALLSLLVSSLAALLAAALGGILFKKKAAFHDLNAVLTGLLFAFLMPAGTPLWMAAAGSFFSIFLVREVYGGPGANPFHPALAGAAFLFVIFPQQMDHAEFYAETPFFYFLAGGTVLVWQRIIRWEAPLFYLGAFFIINLFYGRPFSSFFYGPVFLAAFFLVTDFATAPLTRYGTMVYALVCAALAWSFVMKPPAAKEIVFSILLMNALSPRIDQ